MTTASPARRRSSLRRSTQALSEVAANAARRNRARLLLWIVLGGHLLATLYFLPPDEIFGNPPIVQTDFATHFSQAAVTYEFLTGWGRAWGYDPYQLAGYPAGTVFDLNTKGLELLTAGLAPFVGLPRAFNLVVLALYLVIPLLSLGAARLLGLSPAVQVLAPLLTLLLWYSDAALHWSWAGGTFSFAVASAFLVFCLAALVRYLEHPSRHTLLPLLISVPLTVLMAPQIAVALVPAGIIAGLARSRRPNPRTLAGLGLVGVVTLVINAVWLWPFIRFYDIKTDSAQFLQAGLSTLAGDLLGSGRIDGGSPCYCGLRWLVLGLAVGLWIRGRGRSTYSAPFVVGALSMFALAYLGSYHSTLADLQPYRFVIPASLLAVIPASDALARLANAPPRPNWSMFVLVAVAALLLTRTVQGIWHFRPDLSLIGQPVRPGDGRLGGPPPSYTALFDWIGRNTDGQGRILVNDWRVGTLLPYYTEREIIGGPFLWTWIDHGYANAGIWEAFGRDLESYDHAELRATLERFDVVWVISNSSFDDGFFTVDDLARRWPELFLPAGEVEGYRIYRVSRQPNPFLAGSGRLTAGYNRIDVRNASPDGIVLKYHWLPNLRTNPPLPIRAYPVPGDPVGFIAIDNGTTSDFVIVNGY